MTEAPQRPEQPRTDDTVVPLDRRRLDRRRQDRDPLLRTLLGGVLRQARHDQQRTLSDVADEAGISVPYLSEIERGRKEPSSEMLAAVCGALDLDLIDLVSRSYVDLVGRQLEAEAVGPLRVRPSINHSINHSMNHSVGRSGDVLALAA